MKVKVFLPRSFEADVKYDEKNQNLVIEPSFRHPNRSQTLFHVIVEGKGGVSRKFIIFINGYNGHIKVHSLTKVTPRFDTIDSDKMIDDNVPDTDENVTDKEDIEL